MQRQSLTTSFKQTVAQLVAEQQLVQNTNNNSCFNVIEMLDGIQFHFSLFRPAVLAVSMPIFFSFPRLLTVR